MLPYPSFVVVNPSTPAQVSFGIPRETLEHVAENSGWPILGFLLDACRSLVATGLVLAPAANPQINWSNDGPYIQAEG